MQVGSISGNSPYVNTQDGSIRVRERIEEQIKEANKPSVQENAEQQKNTVQQEEEKNVALNIQSAQGDNLKVTQDGMQSQQAGGTIKENSEDGVVAKKDDVRVTTNTDAARILREQIEKAKEESIEDRITGKESSNDEAYKPQAQVNLAGKTREQVEQLYRKGEISRYEYDKKLEESKEEGAVEDKAAAKQTELVETVAGQKEQMIENKALFDAAENGNQDVMTAAINLGKIE